MADTSRSPRGIGCNATNTTPCGNWLATKVVESWHAMNTWVRATIPMAGAAYRQLINEFYKENRLMAGTLTGTPARNAL